MSDNVDGKSVLVTGGGTGIGAATAQFLASKGANVAIAARRVAKLDDVVAKITATGRRARAYELDVANKAQFKSVVEQVVSDFGRLDVLVNNAGLMPIRPLAEVNTDEWDAMIDVNLRGMLYGVAAALPIFLKQESGHFINMGSVAGVKVFAPGGTVYSGTKFAVHAISEGLRQEVGSKVRVTTIGPGSVESELKHNTTGSLQAAVLAAYEGAMPADTIARAIAYAIGQPAGVGINEILLRPVSQQF